NDQAMRPAESGGAISCHVVNHVANHVAEGHTESPQDHQESLSLRVNAAGEGEGSGEGRSVGETTPVLPLLPADWLPSADDLAYAARHRPDLSNRLPVVTQKF